MDFEYLLPNSNHYATVFYFYQPYERKTWDYPGCDASIDIESIEIRGKELTESQFQKVLKRYGDDILEKAWDNHKPPEY